MTSSTDVIECHRREQLRTDEVRSSMETVQHTFVIKTVIDPRTQKKLTLHEAIRDGIIDSATSKKIKTVNLSLAAAQK